MIGYIRLAKCTLVWNHPYHPMQRGVVMANKMMGLLGTKIGMTQIYSKTGSVIPVTVVSVAGNTVLNIKTENTKDGYNAIQLGFGDKKEKHTNKPDMGNFNKAKASPKKHIREIRLDAEEVKGFSSGQVLSTDVFSIGDKVDVIGRSKGCGFTGVMKRYNFKGFIRSHGTHEYFRHGGSIGTRLTPGHVIKGKKMPGRQGNERVTVQNLTIEKIDAEKGLLFIRGGVPGKNKGFLVVRKAVK